MLRRILSHPTWIGIGALAGVAAVAITVAGLLGAFKNDGSRGDLAVPDAKGLSPRATQVHFVTPFGSGLRRTDSGYEPINGFSFDHAVRGDCEVVSLVDFNNPQAYRCWAPGPQGNDLISYDPCFSLSVVVKDIRLYCWAAPWLRVMTPLTATTVRGRGMRPTPKERAKEHRPPWALRLANGYYCVTASTAPILPIGRALTFACFDGPRDWTKENYQWVPLNDVDGWVAGTIRKNDALWQVEFLGNSSTEITSVPILDAWT